ncbi:hypothetical protein EDD90_6270 [Streptomyces sp. Ag109_O5-1]|nr:hypothetical protein EDD90_6270 [Streptomyces sp. Ag109_O5-1]
MPSVGRGRVSGSPVCDGSVLAQEWHDTSLRHQDSACRNSVITSAKNQMENARHASHSPHKTQRASRRMCISGSTPVTALACHRHGPPATHRNFPPPTCS